MSETRSAGRRRLVRGSTLGAGMILVILLVGLVNYFGWKYHERFDWTASDLYTLSEKSRNVLRDLDREVEAVVFMDPADELAGPVEELMERYDAASPRLSVRVVDPARNIAEAQALVERFAIDRQNVVVFASGDDRRVVEAADLAEYDFSGMQMGSAPEMTGFKGEQAFTSAIVELVEAEKPRIVFTTGHGEARIDDVGERGLSQARDLLGDDNFALETWRSLAEPEVPADTDLVVVPGPTAGFAEPEVEALRRYLEGGGRMLVLLDPSFGPNDTLVATGLEGLLADFGVAVGENIVIDPARAVPFFGAETFFVETYGAHPITDALDQGAMPVILPLARSVAPGEAPPDDLEVDELLLSSAEGWGETDLASLDAVGEGEGDLAGPVTLGVAVSRLAAADPADVAAAAKAVGDDDGDAPAGSPLEAADGDDPGGEGAAGAGTEGEDGEGEGAGAEAADPGAAGQGAADEGAADQGTGDDAGREPGAGDAPDRDLRLVVYGDSDFATNGHLASVGNPTLLVNTMNWLVEREALVAIPPKSPEQVRLNLTRGQLSTIFWLVMVVLPGLAVAAGVTVWLRRRR